jgi:hypothetical protein
MNKSTVPPIVPVLERATDAVALWIERNFSELRLTQVSAAVCKLEKSLLVRVGLSMPVIDADAAGRFDWDDTPRHDARPQSYGGGHLTMHRQLTPEIPNR